MVHPLKKQSLRTGGGGGEENHNAQDGVGGWLRHIQTRPSPTMKILSGAPGMALHSAFLRHVIKCEGERVSYHTWAGAGGREGDTNDDGS